MAPLYLIYKNKIYGLMIDLSSDNSNQFSEWRIKKCIHLKRAYMSSALTEQNTLKTFNFSRFVRTLAYPLSTILAQNELAHAMLSCFLTYFWYSLIQIIFFHDFNFKQLNASSLIWLFGYFVFSEQNLSLAVLFNNPNAILFSCFSALTFNC